MKHTITSYRLGLTLIATLLSATFAKATPAYNTWTTTGLLSTNRVYNTTTVLTNGLVLVVGGHDFFNHPLSSAELYDPTTGNWTPTGSMHIGRFNHTATLLLNGQVLVAGGQGPGGNLDMLNSAELYNPATGAWTVTGFMASGRGSAAATLLTNGEVLVSAGEATNGRSMSGAELYNPSTGTWTRTGGLHIPRQLHSATLLTNGLVLAAGGYGSAGTPIANVETYNTATGTWTTNAPMHTARYYFEATLLNSGQVLVSGGFSSTSGTTTNAELFNPNTGAWTVTGAMTSVSAGSTSALLPNGQVMVAGGSGNDVTLYTPATGTWSAFTPMNFPRDNNTVTLLPNGQVLAVAGYGSTTNAEVYTPTPEYLIDIDFGAGATNSSEVGFAATGETTNDFWNWYTRDDGMGGWLSFGSLGPLQYVDHTPSAAGLTISNAPGAWGNGTSDPMYAGYLYPFDGGNIVVTITNLDPGLYNIYMYGHGNEDDQDSSFDVMVGSTDYGSAATTSTSGWNSVSWAEGMQYVVARAVSVTSTNDAVTVTVSPNSSSYAVLAGMQIVKLITSSTIDIDFGAGATNSSEVGFAATGQSSDDFWNWYTRDDGMGGWLSFGSLAPLLYGDQTASAAGLTISNAPGAWGNGTTDPMYNGYLYPFDGGNITVAVTNLNAGVYNIYVYGHGNEDDQDSSFDVMVDSTDYGSATTTSTSAWNSVDWAPGIQYVVTRNVSIGAGQTLTVTVSPNSSSYAILAGMQIVQLQ